MQCTYDMKTSHEKGIPYPPPGDMMGWSVGIEIDISEELATSQSIWITKIAIWI